MSKVTLDMNTFKALASDSRLDILRALDGKKMSLNDISRATKLNKATLHEHLVKLNQAGLVKKYEREGHKWVYYKLTWKGEGLLHPENTRIVVMFSITFVTLLIGVMLIASFYQPVPIGKAEIYGDTMLLYEAEDEGIPLISSNYNYVKVAEFSVMELSMEEDTVRNVSVLLQQNAKISDDFGNVISVDDIEWYTPTNEHLSKSRAVVAKGSIPLSIPNDSEGYNNSYNDTVKSGDTTDFNAAVPEMIAKTQNPTFLVAAIACIIAFGILFTTSCWRYKKNRKQKL